MRMFENHLFYIRTTVNGQRSTIRYVDNLPIPVQTWCEKKNNIKKGALVVFQVYFRCLTTGTFR